MCLLICLARVLGLLQYLELKTYDIYLQNLPNESKDPRITIVAINESQIQRRQKVSISDATLAQAIRNISSNQPRVLGIDLHRDIPIPPGTEELAQVLKETPEIIGISLMAGSEKIPPHPILAEEERYADSGVIIDSDGVVRRTILFPLPTTSPNIPSLGLALAIKYLEKENIQPQPSSSGWMQIGQQEYPPFNQNHGGYVKAEDGFYQMLLPWRRPPQNFETLLLQDILDNNYDSSLIKDRIVLIGSTAHSLKDTFQTPFSFSLTRDFPEQVFGVHIHANTASAILANALEGRPLVWFLSEPLEYIWISLWCLLPLTILKININNKNLSIPVCLFFQGIILSLFLIGIAYIAFLKGGWLPVVPGVIGIWFNSVLLGNGLYINKLQKTNQELESIVAKRTDKLSFMLKKLTQMQEQMIIQEKTAYLGLLTAGVAHELRNPIFLCKNYLKLLEKHSTTLMKIFNGIFEQPFGEEDPTQFFETYNLCVENIELTIRQIQVAEDIIKNIVPLKNEPTLVQIDLNAAVTTCANLVSKSFQDSETEEKECNFTINYQLEKNLPTFLGNRTEIAQVIINLTENAIHAVCERAKVQPFPPPVIIFATRSLGKWVELSIIDNGIGISPQIKERLFEPFFTTKQTRKGLGLGLPLCQMIVTKHQGEITASSSNNITEFKIKFPLSQNQSR
ncbi:MAG: CHASE2 domain-containing protein [Gloeocapsa sp. DLM2.Bin57]|nr:MAG: CHASE2 domain-containing protein [Gloeocapsa sp. DLM2.Bin57]